MIRRIALIVVVLGSLGLGANSLAAQDCSVAAGQAAFEAGQYADAFDLFQCAYDANPTDTEAALLGIGRAALMLNQFSISANTAEMAAAAAGATNSAYGAQQIDRLNAALVKNAKNAALLTELAHWLWLRARDDEAMPLYDTLLASDPENLFALTFRASSQAYLGQFEDADSGFEQVFALAPDNDHVYAIAATTYLDNGDPERAAELASQAIVLQPDDFAGRYVTRGDAYTDLGQYQAALEDYTRALDLNPGMYNALIGQANANLKLGQIDAGLDAINQALEQNPDSAWALTLRGNLYLGISENELALADFARADELSPNDVNALIGLGDASYNLGEYADTVGYYQQAIAADPDSRYARAGLVAGLTALNDSGAGQALADLFQTADNPVEISAIGKPQTLPLDFATVYFAQIAANTGDTIRASVESVEAGVLDPALLVLDEAGQVVAFADNSTGYDALLDGFVVPSAGNFTVVIGLLDTVSGDARIRVGMDPAS